MPTIVPLTSEAEWRCVLSPVRRSTPPLVPTVVVAPHPDDETLGAGGLIAHLRGQGIPVTIVAVTDGENAYADAVGLGGVREAEQVEALRRLGVPPASIQRLRLPDSGVALHEDLLLERLRPFVAKGMHLVAPWTRDFHPDHEATGRVAQLLAAEMSLKLSFYMFWTWHRGAPGLLHDVSLVSIPLSRLERDAKLYALEAHLSQFSHDDGQPILSPDLLEPARRDFEVYIQ